MQSAPAAETATPVPHETRPGTPPARERVLSAAYDLFSREGIRAVGIDSIVAGSGVAKMTLYRHFPSKDDLVLAFLERRQQLWTRDWLEGEVRRRAETPRAQLLAIFDVFDVWFRRDDFEGCSFINVLLETPNREHRVRVASVGYLAAIRRFIHELAVAAQVDDPDDFTRKWHLLMKGSIVSAGEGDTEAAQRARALGALLLAAQVST